MKEDGKGGIGVAGRRGGRLWEEVSAGFWVGFLEVRGMLSVEGGVGGRGGGLVGGGGVSLEGRGGQADVGRGGAFFFCFLSDSTSPN